jgi:hypothetical protein
VLSVVLALLTFAGRTLHAQGVTGAALQGRILRADSSGIEDVTILVTNTANGERWQTTSHAKGRYSLEQLGVGGPYRVEVRAIGFAPAERADLILALGQRLTADFVLQPAAFQLDTITVFAGIDRRLNGGGGGPATSIPESTMTRLAVPDRDFSRLALLSPLVTLTRPPGRPGGLSIAGQSDRLNALQIDGATNNDLVGSSFLGGIGTPGQDLGARTLSVEAIKELQVVGAPFDVRFGNFAAGLVNAVTKSGSNRLQGSLTGYFADQGLVGKDADGLRGADFENKELGATLGGPVLRDRLAFFVDAGLQRRTFPEDGRLIGSDTTGGADSVGTGIRLASAERFAAILRGYGVDPGDIGAYPLKVPAGNLLAKLTLQLGVNSRLELSHSFIRSEPSLVIARNGVEGYTLTSRIFALPVQVHATRLGWNTSFGGRYTNELLAARLRETMRCDPASAFPVVFVSADAGTLSAGTACTPGFDARKEHILEVTDNLTVALGAHRLTLGTHDERIRLEGGHFLDYFFGTRWTFSSLDALEAGAPIEYSGTLLDPARSSHVLSDLRVDQVGVYLQDQWSPRPRLTVTAGLRSDVPFVSRSPVFNPDLLAELGVDNTRTPSGHVLWSPRLGATYDLDGTGRTLVRGGIGWFAGRPAYKWFEGVEAHTGREALQLVCTGANVPTFTLDPAHQPTTCADGLVEAKPFVNVFDPGFRYPRNLKVALGLDQRLPWRVTGTIDLLYTRGVDQYDLVDLNLASPSPATGEGDRLMYGSAVDGGPLTPHRRSERFGPVIEVRNASGDRAFSFTTQLRRQFSAGMELDASYAYTTSRDRFSASEDVTIGDLSAVAVDGSLDHRRIADAVWSVPHRITFLAAFDLPLGFRGSLFYEGISGTPFTYGINGDANGDGFDGNDAVYVPRHPMPGGDIELMAYDDSGQPVPAAAAEYDTLASFIAGQACLRAQRGRIMRRNSCRSPWSSRTDARFSRLFHTLQGHTLELTLDIFNLAHLLDADWGLVRASDDRLFDLVGFDPDRRRGRYHLLHPARAFALQDASRWRMQLGARYTF